MPTNTTVTGQRNIGMSSFERYARDAPDVLVGSEFSAVVVASLPEPSSDEDPPLSSDESLSSSESELSIVLSGLGAVVGDGEPESPSPPPPTYGQGSQTPYAQPHVSPIKQVQPWLFPGALLQFRIPVQTWPSESESEPEPLSSGGLSRMLEPMFLCDIEQQMLCIAFLM
jgi:hypothetical protein